MNENWCFQGQAPVEVSVDLKLSPGENTSWAWNQEEIMNLKLYSLWFKGRSQRRQGASPPLGHKVQKIQQTYQLKFTFSQEGESPNA